MSQNKKNEFKLPAADADPVVEDLDGFGCSINSMERLKSPWADDTGFSSEKVDLEKWLKGGGKVYPATGEVIEKGGRKVRQNSNLKLALQYFSNPEKQEREEEKSGKNLKKIFWIQKMQHPKALANKINNLAAQITQSDPELTKKEKENLKKRLIKRLWAASELPAAPRSNGSMKNQVDKDDPEKISLKDKRRLLTNRRETLQQQQAKAPHSHIERELEGLGQEIHRIDAQLETPKRDLVGTSSDVLETKHSYATASASLSSQAYDALLMAGEQNFSLESSQNQTNSYSGKQDSKDDAIQTTLPEVNNKAGIIKTPAGFMCPLTKSLMKEPHLAADYYSYDEAAIKDYLQNNNVSPVTGKKLENKDLVKNWNLFKAIQDFQAKWIPFAQHQQMIARVEEEASNIQAQRAQQKALQKEKQKVVSSPKEVKNDGAPEISVVEEQTKNTLSSIDSRNLLNTGRVSIDAVDLRDIAAGSTTVAGQKLSNKDISVLTPAEQLQKAVSSNDLVMVETLLKERCDAGLKPDEWFDILFLAVPQKDWRIFQYLLSADDFVSALKKHLDSSCSMENLFENVSLYSPWRVKDKEKVFAKLARYMDIPPLLQAACLGNIKIIQKKMGEEKQQSLGKEATKIFEYACANGHENIMDLLCKKVGEKVVNHRSFRGKTPLFLAVERSQLGAINYLLDHGAQIEEPGVMEGESPLMQAIDSNRVSAARLLLERGANLAGGGHLGLLALLLKRIKGSFTEEPADTANVLLLADFSDNKAMILLVLDYWIKLTLKSKHGGSLLQRGEEDANGNTPLMLAALQGNVREVLSHLGSDTAALEKSNKLQQTPLLLAVYGGHVKVVELLLGHGAARVTMSDTSGMTILMAAVSCGKAEMVEMLLKRVLMKKSKALSLYIGLSAALAKITNQPAIYELLERAVKPLLTASSQPSGLQPDVASSAGVAEQKYAKQSNGTCQFIRSRSLPKDNKISAEERGGNEKTLPLVQSENQQTIPLSGCKRASVFSQSFPFFRSPRHQQKNKKESKEMLEQQFLQEDVVQELQTVKNSASSSEEVVHFPTSEYH